MTEETRGLIDEATLNCLATGTNVLNINRRLAIDNDVICQRLDSGRLVGAIVDVDVTGPLPSGIGL